MGCWKQTHVRRSTQQQHKVEILSNLFVYTDKSCDAIRNNVTSIVVTSGGHNQLRSRMAEAHCWMRLYSVEDSKSARNHTKALLPLAHR